MYARLFSLAGLTLLMGALASGQDGSSIPRTPDGTPNLKAPAPRELTQAVDDLAEHETGAHRWMFLAIGDRRFGVGWIGQRPTP